MQVGEKKTDTRRSLLRPPPSKKYKCQCTVGMGEFIVFDCQKMLSKNEVFLVSLVSEAVATTKSDDANDGIQTLDNNGVTDASSDSPNINMVCNHRSDEKMAITTTTSAMPITVVTPTMTTAPITTAATRAPRDLRRRYCSPWHRVLDAYPWTIISECKYLDLCDPNNKAWLASASKWSLDHNDDAWSKVVKFVEQLSALPSFLTLTTTSSPRSVRMASRENLWARKNLIHLDTFLFGSLSKLSTSSLSTQLRQPTKFTNPSSRMKVGDMKIVKSSSLSAAAKNKNKRRKEKKKEEALATKTLLLSSSPIGAT